MRKRSMITALICSACLALGSAAPVMADATKVVTLGADLTQEQKNTMMRYFKADANQVHILTITNQDERDQLGSYIPLEQIGTRTLSCAYVKPTQSGGIKVRTANLNYVTGNMIANALSTAGVTNCEAVAACPYEVSGTGALTGVIMAYESASGQTLDSTKKDLATQEVVVTGNLSQQVGQDNATNILNEAKLQIIGQNIQNADEIYNIVNNIAMENNVTLSSDEMNTIVSLLQEIAQQNYDIAQMQQTLENIQQNLNNSGSSEDAAGDEFVDEDSTDGEDITANVDTDALGENIVESSTEDPTLQEETMGEAGDDYVDEGTEIPEASEDGQVLDGTAQDDGVVTPDEETADALNTDDLSEEAKASFDKAKAFCTGEYEGDTASLQSVMGPEAYASVAVTPEIGAKLTQKVLEAYINVLRDGGVSYLPMDTDIYMSSELNMVNAEMKIIFGIDTELTEEDVLVYESPEVRQALYDDTMKFFEVLYGENVETTETTETVEEGTGEAVPEEYVDETADTSMEDIPYEEAVY